CIFSCGSRSHVVLRCLAILLAVLPLITRANAGNTDSPKDRARNAEALGEKGSSAIPALETLLKDPEAEVRLQAVKSLVRIGTQHSLTPLIQATTDADEEIQIRATDGLVEFYYPGYVKNGLSGSLKR